MRSTSRNKVFVIFASMLILTLFPSTNASIAYGTLNNFDCVNDTGVEAHGFEIELDDMRSTEITYTYDYNHYGIPKITQDNSDPAHPKVTIRYAATRDSSGKWSAFTAIPSGPITPTDGHQFTNPSINFGGEHFGAGYYGAPSAVRYHWLVDDGSGNLIAGPPVYIATPTFVYYPPAPAQAPQVQAVIVPPPPPDPPVLQFGKATWVKDIKTVTHNAGKVELTDLVDPDPEDPEAPNWANGEPAEVETEWRLLQTEFANADNPKGVLEGAPQELPEGDEVVTRRYEFYKYIGPIDQESGEAMADAVAADGIHGVGSVTFNDHIDPLTGEWVEVTVDLSTVEVVAEFIGAQMSGFDVAPVLGLIDHIPDGELNVPYAERTVVVAGGAAFLAAVSGSLPAGTTLNETNGVFSGTPTLAGVFTFTVEAWDTTGAYVTNTYTVTIPEGAVPATATITTTASPAEGGTVSGGGIFEIGTPITVTSTHNPDYAFVNWTESNLPVSDSETYPFTVNGDRNLVANFVRVTYAIVTTAAPAGGGTTSGGGTVNSGDSVTVVAVANAGYTFVNWTEGAAIVSTTPSYNFAADANRSLVANFVPVYAISTSASPASGGTTTGDGIFSQGDNVTVQAVENSAYHFVNWTEGSVVVSVLPSYTFTVGANRALVANFAPRAALLSISSASAVRIHGKIDVTVSIANSGDSVAQGVTLEARRDAMINGKAMKGHAPIEIGDIQPGQSATTVLTFAGVKAGIRTLRLDLIYSGGTATLTVPVTVP
ncbi:MAG TPA: putative Ig domain-containing protein [Verrucomicrobiae bacterium]